MAAPLEGLQVLELVRVAPGAFCTMMLADMGAEVLKIETPDYRTAPWAGGEERPVKHDERLLISVNRNKRSMAL